MTELASSGSLARNKVADITEAIKKIDGHLGPDDFDVKHSFADGMYIREMFIPKGMLLVGKIHKHTTPTFVMEGDITVVSEDGLKRIKAPCSMVASIGAKCGYAHEDTRWVTVHETKETDLEKIEEEIIAKTFEEIGIEAPEISSDDAIEQLKEMILQEMEQEGLLCHGEQ